MFNNVLNLLILILCGLLAAYWGIHEGGRSAWLCTYGIGTLLVYLGMVYISFPSRIRVHRSIEHSRCWSGEAITMELRMHFRGFFSIPSVWLSIEEIWSHIGTDEKVVFKDTYRPSLSRAVKLNAVIPGLPRGLYRLEAMTISISDAFGLLHISRKVPVGEHELQVLPRPRPLQPNLDGAGGELQRRSRQQQLQRLASSPLIYGTRPYAPGDPLSRIHWRATARAGALRAKESEQPGMDRLLICIDAAAGPSNAAAFESAIEAAAGLAKRALELGLTVRLAASDRQGRVLEAQGRERLPELLRLLALLPCNGDRPLAGLVQRETLHLSPGAGIAIITAQPDEQLLHLLCRLRSRAVQLVYIHSEANGPDAVEQWRRQARAARCRFTAVGALSRRTAEGGAGDVADANRSAAVI